MRSQVWDAYIPYNDGPHDPGYDTGKTRPVVIIGWSSHDEGEDGNLVVVPITTFSGNPPNILLQGDIEISNIMEAGLDSRKRSFIRARRFITIAYKSIDTDGYRGLINDQELAYVIREITSMLALKNNDRLMLKNFT